MPDETNDNRSIARTIVPAAYGQAAYLLVESLVHVLIEQSVVTRAKAVDVVDQALDVRLEVAHDADDTSDAMLGSIALLKSLASTLRADEPR